MNHRTNQFKAQITQSTNNQGKIIIFGHVTKVLAHVRTYNDGKEGKQDNQQQGGRTQRPEESG